MPVALPELHDQSHRFRRDDQSDICRCPGAVADAAARHAPRGATAASSCAARLRRRLNGPKRRIILRFWCARHCHKRIGENLVRLAVSSTTTSTAVPFSYMVPGSSKLETCRGARVSEASDCTKQSIPSDGDVSPTACATGLRTMHCRGCGRAIDDEASSSTRSATPSYKW